MISGGILLAGAGWAFTFALDWGNFWIKIGLTVMVTCLYSLFWQKPALSFRPRNAALGVLAALLLYGIFYLGFALSPFVVPDAVRLVETSMPEATGPLQRRCPPPSVRHRSRRGGFLAGLSPGKPHGALRRRGRVAMTTLIYGTVHVFSLNFMLVLAAFVAGAFWGGLYLWRRDLVPVMVSHSLWSACIFAVFPIR